MWLRGLFTRLLANEECLHQTGVVPTFAEPGYIIESPPVIEQNETFNVRNNWKKKQRQRGTERKKERERGTEREREREREGYELLKKECIQYMKLTQHENIHVHVNRNSH